MTASGALSSISCAYHGFKYVILLIANQILDFRNLTNKRFSFSKIASSIKNISDEFLETRSSLQSFSQSFAFELKFNQLGLHGRPRPSTMTYL